MRTRWIVAVFALILVPLPALAARLTETGSTLLYPLITQWAAAYGKQHTELEITTAATGSGAGIAGAGDGTTILGASDAYLTPAQRARGLVNIPLAISGQHIAYNLPGVAHLRLTAEVLAHIYSGAITTWNDPRIAAINPGTALPNLRIIPIHRSEGSGDTFLFTEFLVKAGEGAWNAGSGTRITWPDVPGAQSARGNSGLLELVHAVPASIGYVGVSYLAQTRADGLGVAALRNRAGIFVEPDAAGMLAAAQAAGKLPPDGGASLIDERGAHTYPIANYEYAVVREHQADDETATDVRNFLLWVIDPSGGNAEAMLGPVHFASLPHSARAVSMALITRITGPAR
jgi:phosphate transport system substrate-binding protein